MRPLLSLRTWLTASHLVVLLLPLVVVFGTGALATDLIRQTQADIEHQADILALWVAESIEGADDVHAALAERGPTLSPWLKRARESTLAGIRIVDDSGIVTATSGDGLGENLSSDPAVATALRGTPGVSVRPRPPPTVAPLDSTSRRAHVRVYVASPIVVDGQLVGAVQLSRTPREEIQTLYQMAPNLVGGVLVALLGTLLLALTAAQRFGRSLRGMATAAQRLAEGDFTPSEGLGRAHESRVAEIQALSHSVQTMSTRLQERLVYISEFAGNVSHEFRTPISTLRGMVELLRDDPEMPPEQRMRFLGNALHDLERMERLVRGLLQLARAEEGALRTATELDPLIHRVAERFGIEVVGAAKAIHANKEQLEAVLGNLLDNAYHYGGEDVNVTVTAWFNAERTGFEVCDDGPGITEANLEHIFARFFTTDRAGGGTGIGLALARAVCASHGGTITVQSQPGATCFRVDLPRCDLA